MKTIAILGSTGSIGTQSIDVAQKRGYKVAALTAHSNAELLERQARLLKPEKVALYDENAAKDLKIKLRDTNVEVLSGMQGICECAAVSSADTVINSIVGMAGLRPTLAVINAGKQLALANKESLVAGGKLVTESARKNGVPILPVDSEHSAIFQCLQGKPSNRALKKIILTASGGPFFGKTKSELENVTAADALKHPNWSMGAKITIDSATMFNKGLELIEAVWLFGVEPSMVDIVVHRESIVHSMVEYDDNAVIAQLGLPDMRIPIQYALTYPERYASPVEEIDFASVAKLTFYKPDYDTFRCINICRSAIDKGGLAPAAVNSANEEINRLFREGKVRFNDIPDLITEGASAAPNMESYTADDIDETDKVVRSAVLSAISRKD
ncbi:MAG: 1-deoxy-D-xylulose-5-phosphate reductoisomerase [Clostridiales bacterium]|nr:1-deoxy-D-xylulose-5-phosphate reductoisomerase [Clostridiales bacterium]MCD7827569.1 1-deoxy-D-xylulose-5-phosphate reductoisomerase [Clostridiales bacterium]